MKILQLCKKFPYPVKDGEAIAITYLGKALHQLGCKVSLLAMNTKKHYFNTEKLPEDFNFYHKIFQSPIDTDVKAFDAFKNLFSKDSYHISRFCCPDFEAKLIEVLRSDNYDVVQLETLYLAPYIPVIRKYSNAQIAMRAHNVEHEIWQRITENTQSPVKKLYLNYLTGKLRDFEQQQLLAYDILLPITHRDLKYFRKMGYSGKALVTPIGLDGNDYEPDDSSFGKKLSISFIGSLDWMPNLEGLNWFLNEIWPTVIRKFPELELHIAGRNTPDWMFKMNKPNVRVYGEVPDADTFINAHSVMVVPLLSGSGMRAKILEGMVLGKVMLTTSLGLEGIKANNKAEVLIADTPEEFLKCIEFCYQNDRKIRSIGNHALELVHREYDNLEIARRVVASYEKMIPKLTQNVS